MKPINAKEAIGIIPDELLDKLALENKVDYSVKKLQGKVVFQLFLYGILSGKRISLRILEAIFNSQKFKNLFEIKPSKIKHSGLGMRLQNIDYKYFENIFKYLVSSKKVDAVLFDRKKINIRKIDSTMVVLSSKLLHFGMTDNAGKHSLKYTLELNQGIPVNLILFKDQSYLSEEKALPEMIKQKSVKKGLNIAIFDRGIRKKFSFVDFAKSNIHFISRLTIQKYEVLEKLKVKVKETPTLKILSDQIIRFSRKVQTIDQEFRLVIGKNKITGEIIPFITTVRFLEAHEITELYRSRWEIETFFRFIKQELNFSHLLSRNENGIRVVMYLTMIAAILLTIYKKTNRIIGWTVAKIKFLDELESDLMHSWHYEISPVFLAKNNSFLANARGG